MNVTPAVCAHTALITGSSTGIGKVLCVHLLEQGYAVVAMARRATDIQHPHLHSVCVDLADRAATAQAAADVARRFAITTFVHNAGVIRPSLLPEVNIDDLVMLTALHLGSAITLAQAVLPAMRAQRYGTHRADVVTRCPRPNFDPLIRP